jgi:cytochrome c2
VIQETNSALLIMKSVRMTACVVLMVVIMSACGKSGAEVMAERVSGGNSKNGEHLIFTYGCGTCHVIPGISGANGTAGPPLKGFASRTYIAGVLQNWPENLVRWITQPQEVTKGTAMPDLGVTRDQARDMAAYLYTLQ